MSCTDTHSPADRDGFTLVELLVAVLVLAVGLLGLAATTGFVARQTMHAGAATERTVARQSALEEIRSLPFDSVDTGSRPAGRYTVSWSTTASDGQFKTLEVTTVGPGLRWPEGSPPVMEHDLADTLTLRIASFR